MIAEQPFLPSELKGLRPDWRGKSGIMTGVQLGCIATSRTSFAAITAQRDYQATRDDLMHDLDRCHPPAMRNERATATSGLPSTSRT